ncbi:MAG: ABC transporter ATP-binding protein [Alphaproteobacteria bacterium]
MKLLELSNVEAFYGPVMAIRGVSLSVESGSIVAVLGANGAGKTTVLRAVSGAVEPRKGTITFGGKDITGLEPADIVEGGIAHVPEGREVFPHLTVRENLIMGAYSRRDRAAIAADIDAIYGHFPVLRKRERQHAGTLSGGEQQMLAIGRALLSRPKLLLLDEPSLGLSPLLTEEIFGIVRNLNREQGLTVLLVEQNANLALDIAHFGYILEVGRVVMEGTTERLLANEDVREFYLGMRDEGVRGEKRWKRTKKWR